MTLTDRFLADPAPRDARLALAFDEGLILPDGPIVVLNPRAGERFDPLPAASLCLVQGFWPDHDALASMGYRMADTPPACQVALVCLPRAKADALALIAQAAQIGAQIVLVDGQKTDGIDSVLKAVRARVDVAGPVSKAHGKLFWFDPRAHDFSDWAAKDRVLSCPDLGQFCTRPGVFSADGIDPASALLAAHLPPELPARVVDLGAGWGYLSRAALARPGIEELHLVEACAQALALARTNITDPRAQFHWADATSFALPHSVNAVIMNPPFHTGRAQQPALGQAFIANAATLLGTRGKLWMVANRHLPYADTLDAHFVHVDILAQTGSFRVWQASQPKRAKQHGPASTGLRSRKRGQA